MLKLEIIHLRINYGSRTSVDKSASLTLLCRPWKELANSSTVLSSFDIAKKDIPSDCVLGSNISSSVVNADVSKDASVNLWTSSSTSHDSASCPFTALAKVVTASQTDCKDSKNLEDSAKEVVEDKRKETLTLAEVDLVAGEREMPVIRQHCRAHNSDANEQRCNNHGPFHFELNDVHNNGAEKNNESLCRSRKVVRLVYDGRLLINTLSWLQMPAALVDSRTLRMVAINEVGSYVMAAWRNDFQYLAEVLAHRQRHGTRAEYRLRYIWDRVVEWTPVSKLRKATQYEIDYVLKFCKEQGTLSTNKIPSKFDLQYSCSSSNDSASGTSQAKRIRTNVSESKSIDRTSDPETHRYRSRPTHVSTSGFSVLEGKKTFLPTLFDGIIEQDGMVCDKSVFQFHEACRRRRELKRKAIEENDTCPHGFDSSVSVLSQTFTIRSNHQNRCGLNSQHNSIRTENYAAEATVASPPVSSI
ncbi:unnamed protein product [Schistosoma turkestanicum]|nr:unnamed protein product [Schistosoma turkestanicum]